MQNTINTIIIKIALVFCFFLLFYTIQASIPDKPNPPRLVNDFAKLLSEQTTQELEFILRAFSDSTSTQITIVTINNLGDYEPSDFAFRLGEKWGIGQKGLDNGVVVLVKPKLSNSDRGHAYIAVGYGLEGAIPDAIGKRIVELEMIPAFKQNNYEKGIVLAAQSIMKLASGEYTAANYGKKKKKTGSLLLPLLFFLAAIILIVLGTLNRARHYALGHNVSFWTALWLMSAMDTAHRGRYSDFSSGRGGFGGFGGGSGFGSGGGFGGFGGGSFGGGGAGGSW